MTILRIGRRFGVLLTALAASVWVAGCATGPAFVAPDTPKPGEALIYVYRIALLPGALIKHAVTVNGRPAGRLMNGSYLAVPVALHGIGQYVRLQAEGCEGTGELIWLAPGQTAYAQTYLVSKTFSAGGNAYFDFGCKVEQRSAPAAMHALVGLRAAGEQKEGEGQ